MASRGMINSEAKEAARCPASRMEELGGLALVTKLASHFFRRGSSVTGFGKGRPRRNPLFGFLRPYIALAGNRGGARMDHEAIPRV